MSYVARMTHTRIPNKEVRHLVLIDIENLAATPSPSQRDVLAVKAALEALLPDFDMAFWVIACSHHAAPTVAFEFPSARHLWRSGRDGADMALLDVLEEESVEKRFDKVSICSGDGIFADEAGRLATSGVEVTAIARTHCLSAQLQLAVRHVHHLEVGDRRVASASVA